jgi:hypothetical protein
MFKVYTISYIQVSRYTRKQYIVPILNINFWGKMYAQCIGVTEIAKTSNKTNLAVQ